MNRSFVAAVSMTAVLLCSGSVSADVVKGRVKSIDYESNLFSLSPGKDRIVLVQWDGKTAWNGMTGPSDIKTDENLTVDLKSPGDNSFARTVSRIKTPLPAGARLYALENLLGASTKGVALVDTRPLESYDSGHIPGAVSAPLTRLAKSRAALLPEDHNGTIVFYDEGQGGESAGKGFEIAVKAGFANAAIFAEGVWGWESSGGVLAVSTAYIRKTHPVLLDIRAKEAVAEGHIEGAVNYPVSGLEDYFRRYAVDKLTPIVVYGASDKEAVDAARTIKELGFRRVSFFPGGVSAWSDSAEALVKGPVHDEMPSTVMSHGGRLSGKDFELALISPLTVEIVDVRSEAEQKLSGFPKSKKIPLSSLSKRHGELDRDKIQVLFGADSLRAEIAYDFLRSKEYRVNYLNGSVEFHTDGKYIIK